MPLHNSTPICSGTALPPTRLLAWCPLRQHSALTWPRGHTPQAAVSRAVAQTACAGLCPARHKPVIFVLSFGTSLFVPVNIPASEGMFRVAGDVSSFSATSQEDWESAPLPLFCLLQPVLWSSFLPFELFLGVLLYVQMYIYTYIQIYNSVGGRG